MVHPHINYCIEVWGSAYQSHINSLVVLQKKAIRIITFSHFQAHTEPLFKKNRILPLSKLYFLSISLLVFTELSGHAVINFGFQTHIQTHYHNTRNKHRLTLPKHNTNYGCKSITHVGPKIFNQLPPAILNSPSPHVFKRKVKHWLFDNTNFDLSQIIYPHRY